jgi:hypothetical protein
MKLVPFLAALAAGLCLAGAAAADEGFWPFESFPAAKVRAAYGVEITPAWLDHVRAASVRLSVGCSGAVVSGAGLVLTNNHCVSDCTHDLSSAGHDDYGPGFQAAARTDEQTCPGLVAEVLIEATDVTPAMTQAGAGLTGGPLLRARAEQAAALENGACGADPKAHCEVVSLYRGGRFHLYKYRKYDDVRLVFAPGDAVGNFGGDPDNFNFPRYDLDCAFLRLYDDGKPVASPEHLRWNPAPPTAGEPVFTAGDPGDTHRAQTVAELENERDVALPVEIGLRAELRGRLIRFSEESPANALAVADALDDLENDYKVSVGLLAALDAPGFMDRRRADEAALKAKALPLLGPGAGDPWADLAAAQTAYAELFLPYRQLEGGPQGSQLFQYARRLVRAALERHKPPAERLPEYDDSQLPAIERQLLDPKPVQPALEQLSVEFWLSKTRELLGADDSATKLVLGKESPESLSKRLVEGSHLADPAVRQALWQGGLPAIEASDDPMIAFALAIDPAARAARAAFEDKVEGPVSRAAETIARVRFQVLGDSVYPDGTFTPRVSYGAVAGWTWRGRETAPFTDFAGLYGRATGQPPFRLDPRWVEAESRLGAHTVFNFTTTNDIVGGGSGSPVLNARGEVIGAAFDGNMLSIGGDYGYDGSVNRTVAVSAAAIDEALRKVYRDDALAAELAAP